MVAGVPGAEDRFSALLSDATRLSGDEVRGWGDTRAKPALDGRPLLDPANPARWIRDRSIEPPATPRAFVELWGGDLLPGRVVAYRTGEEESTPPPRARSSSRR